MRGGRMKDQEEFLFKVKTYITKTFEHLCDDYSEELHSNLMKLKKKKEQTEFLEKSQELDVICTVLDHVILLFGKSLKETTIKNMDKFFIKEKPSNVKITSPYN